MTVPPAFTRGGGLLDSGNGEVTGSVSVPGEVGVAVQLPADEDGLRPRPLRPVRREEQVAAAPEIRRHQVEPAVVVPQGRGEDAARTRDGLREHQLGRTFQGVADLLPVAQVPRAEDRNAREVLEAGAGEVVVLSYLADARVGVESGDDRVRRDGGPRHVDIAQDRSFRRPGWIRLRGEFRKKSLAYGTYGGFSVDEPLGRDPGRPPTRRSDDMHIDTYTVTK